MTDTPRAPATILFVDDEATAVKYFQRAIGALAPVLTAGSVEEGKQVLDANAERITVLVSDQRMPGAYGNELLVYARERYPHMVRILTTAYSEIEYTVDAVNHGEIHRYIQKPWAIAALRMELKQALDLAELQRERALLMREKLQVGRRQLLASRIGALYALCASVGEPGEPLALAACLEAAQAAGLEAPAPDWQQFDHAELVAAEAWRSAALRTAAAAQLARLEQQHPHASPQAMLEVLAALLGAERSGEQALRIERTRVLTEYLEQPSMQAVSAQHGGWLAVLLWLARRGWTLGAERDGDGVRCTLAAAGAPLQPAQLAGWIARLQG